MRPIGAALSLMLLLVGCAAPPESPEPAGEEDVAEWNVVADLEDRLAQFAPTELQADLSGIPDGERAVLRELIEAAKLMDEIFWLQVWEGNEQLRLELEGAGQAVRTYADVNFGPFDRLDEMRPFLGDTPHPPGANFYPSAMTREEFDGWLERHPEDREALTGLFSVIRRSGDGLVAVPYSEVYSGLLDQAAARLRAAAAATDNASLERFLSLRADAFATDDYYESDMAWMDLSAPVEITIGPYEVYEDALFAYKASFEAFVTVVLPAQSIALERFKEQLPWLERNLPIPEEHKNLERGSESPIRVADVVFTAGDAKAGVQTIAFNLPNDERVREAKGSKKVLLRNVMRGKYDQILVPIAERVLVPDQLDNLSFDAFFAETLHHELSHGLGPGKIQVDGRETEVRLELKELYSTLEEAKADAVGVYDILALIEEGGIPAELRTSLEPTYVAGLFRSARFGVHEAHGRGVLAQFNYLLEQGALEIDGEGRFTAVSGKFGEAIERLARELLMLQANGDYEGTAMFLERYGRPTEAILAAIDRLGGVPVDIRPIYPMAGG